MFRKLNCLMVVLYSLGSYSALAGTGQGWVEFVDETNLRLIADPTLGVSDTEEKDYIWEDVDNDGDLDIICVRKEPFTTSGRRRNVLFMNEGIADGQALDGVFVDRTAQFMSAADDGGQGFLDETNDRDVMVSDLNNDGWFDVITAVTLSEGMSKTISHPRIYMNLGEDLGGNWLGFRYEESRIPQMSTIGGVQAPARFCSVSAGDVTGDGFPDLYFGDYDSGPQPHDDINDRLFINDGTGNFTDSLETRMSNEMLRSAFGMATAIVDMNGDGVLDIVKDTALADPRRVSISYNDPLNEGFFDTLDIIYTNAPYHITVGDLNNDALPDIVVTDDGTDRYMINQGNGPDGFADFFTTTFSFQTGSDNNFGGNSIIADMNNDGLNDVIITGNDVDAPGCGRPMNMYRNLGDTPNVTLQRQGPDVPWSPPGVHDIAVFDINGDGYEDMFMGTCDGTIIWINEPPIGIVFSFPSGFPGFVEPLTSEVFQVQLTAIGGGSPLPNSLEMFVQSGGGSFVQQPVTPLGGDLYEVSLPSVACTEVISFYFNAELDDNTPFSDPPAGLAAPYRVTAAAGTQVTLRDELEDDTSQWSVVNEVGLTSGGWEVVDPIGTVFNTEIAAPEDDASAGQGQVNAFVTENGVQGGAAGDSDVDGGPTHLISPQIDLAGTDATISWQEWMYCDEAGLAGADFLQIYVSNNNGTDWTFVKETGTTFGQWTGNSFQVGDFVVPTTEVRVRFTVDDSPNSSVTEAGIDNFQVEKFVCDLNCVDSSACQDTLFCNGAESCDNGLCIPGTNPCSGQICDETNDVCVDCISDGDCDDGIFCNGTETCSAGVCQSSAAPCGFNGLTCDENLDACTGCASTPDCDDGSFCNGTTTCGNAGVENGTFDGNTGWADNLAGDGAITYNNELSVTGNNAAGGQSVVFSEQIDIDLLSSPTLEFDMLSYTSTDVQFWDYPIIMINGTMFGLDQDGTIGQQSDGSTTGQGTINNANPAPALIHFVIDLEAAVGAGPYSVGLGVSSADSAQGPGIAVYDNVLPNVVSACKSNDDTPDCGSQLCDDNLEACVDCLSDSDCGGQFCDNGTGSCAACVISTHCDDGDFCNGEETCDGGGCTAGTPPVCDDGLFCNGVESCDSVLGCVSSGTPCDPGQICNEASDACESGGIQPRAGEPLNGLTAAELLRFEEGKILFDQVLTPAEGLGPIFNQNSCGACHNTPLGGSSSITVTRFGQSSKGGFDPLAELGGTLLQAQTLDDDCQEVVPPEANVTTARITPSTLGFGLIEAIVDQDIIDNANNQPAGVSGRVHMVPELENPGNPLRAGRFGWKAQLATVLSFSGDASLNEMGLTNRIVPNENAPNGNMALLAQCDTVPDPEDGPDGEGFDFIDRVTDFQRFLAAPPQTPRSGMTGETIFMNIGCADCHVPSFNTGPAVESAIANRAIRPYSDFLLHDMGLLGDGIADGDATVFEMRTPLLWGVRFRDPLLHDGRVAGGTFESRIVGAIDWHDVTGSEGQASAQAFDALSQNDKDLLISFLDSLGRAEFDFDGDNDVDQSDHEEFLNCMTDPDAGTVSPDDPCARFDFDQDGDNDLQDWSVMQRAYTGDMP